MEALLFARISILFLLFSVTLGINLDDNLIARLGFSANFGVVMVGAIVCTLFVAGRHALIVATVIFFSLNANMPIEFSLNMGYDRHIYGGLMLALVLQPLLMRVFD